MSPEAWLAIIATVVIQALTAAYVYGKLTEKVNGHSDQHRAHEGKFKQVDAEQGRQWETIGTHGERISAVEARVTSVEREHEKRRDLGY